VLELFNTFDKVHISLILVYLSTVFFIITQMCMT